MGRLRRLHRDYGDRAEFLFVYIREANHAIPEFDGALANLGVHPDDPDYRVLRLKAGVRFYGLGMPCLLDTEDMATQTAYGAWPERLVLIDRHGLITWDGGWGLPRGFDYGAAEDQLKLLLSQTDGVDPEPPPPAAEGA